MVKSDDGKEEFEIREFLADVEQLNLLWWTMEQYGIQLFDGEVLTQEQFNAIVMSQNTMVLEIGDVGIVYAFNIRPRRDALLKFVFLDKQTHNRQRAVLSAVRWLVVEFDLQRVSLQVPSYMRYALKRMHRMGIMFEGKIRSAYEYKGSWVSMYLFGILRNELTSQAVDRGRLFRRDVEERWFLNREARPRF